MSELVHLFEKFEAKHTQSLDEINRRLDDFQVKEALRPWARPSGGAAGELVRTISNGLPTLNTSGRLIAETRSLLLETKDGPGPLLRDGITTPRGMPGVATGGRWPFGLRQLFRTEPTTAASIFFVREEAVNSGAAWQTEGETKGVTTVELDGVVRPLETLAHIVTVSRQALDDLTGLGLYLDQTLHFGLEEKVEDALLNGTGVSPEIEGVIDGAAAFDPSLLIPPLGWQALDVLAAAATQLRIGGFVCDAFVLHPADWHGIETLKDGEKRYLIGDPRTELPEVLWNRRVIVSPKMQQGEFVALDSSRFHIRQREMARLDVSFETGQNFERNLVSLRLEERLALIITQPHAAVHGSLGASPE